MNLNFNSNFATITTQATFCKHMYVTHFLNNYNKTINRLYLPPLTVLLLLFYIQYHVRIYAVILENNWTKCNHKNFSLAKKLSKASNIWNFPRPVSIHHSYFHFPLFLIFSLESCQISRSSVLLCLWGSLTSGLSLFLSSGGQDSNSWPSFFWNSWP